MNDPTAILGLDVGGAHLKAALLDSDGVALWATQVPCQLWRGMVHLERALEEVDPRITVRDVHHVMTMTGELADIFSNRQDGVLQLSNAVANWSPSKNVSIYAGMKGFVTAKQANEYISDIASANWLASAEFVAAQHHEALLIDIGSTTTDISVIHQGKPIPLGFTDAERLRTHELVYTGIVRTPVMAVANRISFGGKQQGVAAELFATMSDVYRLTGELDLQHDMSATADGTGKTVAESARRLARMVGHDVRDASMAEWHELAGSFKRAQLNLLLDAVESAISRGLISDHAKIVGAGAGRFLVRQLATQIARGYLDIVDLINGDADARQWGAVCAPACAVAWLATRSKPWRH